MTATKPRFFKAPDQFRAWLEANHDQKDELVVGFYKKATGKPSITWAEAVDEALCFGWIDGRGRRIDEKSHTVRFTPRRRRSIWSSRNIGRVEALTAEGRMAPAGLAAFEARDPERSEVYSHEKGRKRLSADFEKRLRAEKKAWEFLESQPPGYRRTVAHWVMSAKQEETRERRLGALIEDSKAGLRVKPLRR